MTATETGTGVATRLLDAIARRDYDALAACFAPGARLRGLVPRLLREEEGPQAIADRYRVWLGDADEYDVLETAADELFDVVRVRYAVRTVDPGVGRPSAFEQIGYAQVEGGRITVLNLVCSGNRPVAP